MKFKRDDEVKIKTHNGTSLGYILEDIDLHGETYWWCQYQLNGQPEVSPFSEKHLSEWNTTHVCTCGAASVKAPGHAYHCEANGDLG